MGDVFRVMTMQGCQLRNCHERCGHCVSLLGLGQGCCGKVPGIVGGTGLQHLNLGDTVQSITGMYYLLDTYFAPGAEPSAVLYISDLI